MQGITCVIRNTAKKEVCIRRKGKKRRRKMTITISKERERYEKLIESRSSDTEWWRVKTFLESLELELTEKNLILYLRLNKISNGRIKRLANAKEKILKHRANLSFEQYYSGKAFLNYLSLSDLQPSQSTLSRWFKQIGGFKASNFYLGKDLFEITIKALMYKEKTRGN
jgi:hypothetical protein